MEKRYRHILIATDFSDDADRALRAGAAIARHAAARVTLLHTFDASMFERAVAPMLPADLESGMAKAAQDRLERLAEAELVDLEGVDCVALHASSAAQAIVEHAENHRADLIVVGTRGQSGLRRMFVGSVSERVIRHAPCDVLMLQHEDGAADRPLGWPPLRILVTTDFSEPSLVALHATRTLAAALSVPVVLVHVYDESVPAPSSDGGFFETLDEGLERTGGLLRDLATQHLGPGADALVCHGLNIATKVSDVAKDQGVGVVVVGTHGRTGLKQMLIGSVAERIARHAPCAVLVVRPPKPPSP